MPNRNEPKSLLLDTHIWVHYINAESPLKAAEIAAIDKARQTASAYISIISIWEVALLERKGRIDLPGGITLWTQNSLQIPGIQLLSLTPEIAIESVALPDTLNRDPSDRIIVATARIENLRLMSHDKDILRFAKQTKLEIA